MVATLVDDVTDVIFAFGRALPVSLVLTPADDGADVIAAFGKALAVILVFTLVDDVAVVVVAPDELWRKVRRTNAL